MTDLERFTYRPGSPTGPPAPGPSIEVIARQVYDTLPLPIPQPHTSPAVDARQLVGLPIWLWVDGVVWRNFETSASLGGVTVTVTARPRHVRWDMGDGHSLTCDRGTPWDPAGPSDQRTGCSHLYQFVSDDEPGGRYAASVAVVWSVSWTASTGEGGSLPDASRSAGFSLDVGERQAVIDYGT
jgi:hypothetical protein